MVQVLVLCIVLHNIEFLYQNVVVNVILIGRTMKLDHFIGHCNIQKDILHKNIYDLKSG